VSALLIANPLKVILCKFGWELKLQGTGKLSLLIFITGVGGAAESSGDNLRFNIKYVVFSKEVKRGQAVEWNFIRSVAVCKNP
jgi:hypothetical protein